MYRLALHPQREDAKIIIKKTFYTNNNNDRRRGALTTDLFYFIDDRILIAFKQCFNGFFKYILNLH